MVASRLHFELKMKNFKKPMDQKVVWAVDAFPESLETQVQAGGGARFFLEHSAAEIEPVYVYCPDPPGIFVQETPDIDRPWLDTGRKNLSMLVKLAGLPRVQKPKFIKSTGLSVRAMVESLVDFAINAKADLILVGSNSRRGVARLLMGSFAEELVLKSPLPVLVTSKKAGVTNQSHFNTFLFPTDFSDSSRKVFDEVVDRAKNLGVEIVLLHQIELFHISLPYPFVVPSVGKEAFDEVVAQAQTAGKAWMDYADSHGVAISFNLVRKMDDAATVIVKAARKFPSCVIVMASRSGPIETKIVGSNTRKVLRSAACPVLVLHPE